MPGPEAMVVETRVKSRENPRLDNIADPCTRPPTPPHPTPPLAVFVRAGFAAGSGFSSPGRARAHPANPAQAALYRRHPRVPSPRALAVGAWVCVLRGGG